MCCIAAVCNTKTGDQYSLQRFYHKQDLYADWVRVLKQHQSNWYSASMHSMLCFKCFEVDCFVTEGVQHCGSIGLPTKKC